MPPALSAPPRSPVSGTRRDELAAAFDERHWRAALLVVCGAYYVLLGATGLGPAGVLGILGGVLIWITARVAASKWIAYALLLGGALPFAAATWWRVITPVVAVLSVIIGRGVILRAGAVAHHSTRPALALR